METIDPKELLTEREVSDLISVQTNTLAVWRTKKIQLDYIYISQNCVRYRKAVVEAWLKSKEVKVHPIANTQAV